MRHLSHKGGGFTGLVGDTVFGRPVPIVYVFMDHGATYQHTDSAKKHMHGGAQAIEGHDIAC